ncbi:transmembrane channel-like protein isoform X2 [Frankliniella occidentalis]|uniref:Transmembrane channel-like protein isoform X2 n=1 Tax=Frankliniella occidentalis TaxID=133901 RepID=A0A9C6U5G3_FRAOC|nr:transmembrane channel-like protein isoform X2 [Frankliniella occidentalis]
MSEANTGGPAPPYMGLSALPGAAAGAGATGVAGRRGRTASPSLSTASNSAAGAAPTTQTPTTGILRLNINKPRRSSGSSVEFRTPLDGYMQVEPTSPQPSVDRLSVTFAAEERSICSDASVRVNVMPSTGTLAANGYGQDAADRTAAGLGDQDDDDDDDDEDYSVSMSAIIQRRASTRRSRRRTSRNRRGSHARRPSSPFSPDADSAGAPQSRRRSSVFTTSSADTAVSLEGSGGGGSGPVTQEQILENLRVHKEVLGGVKMQPWGMRRKLRLVRQAKTYVKRHEGQLHERFAHSRATKDIAARFNLWMIKRWQWFRREIFNLLNMLMPWELRIKEIESHFGSAVASYFTFLRWLCLVNLVIVVVILAFVSIPEILTADPKTAGERKEMLDEERKTAYNLYTLWDFEGPLRYSPLFYGYYTDRDSTDCAGKSKCGKGYRLPFAYFMTGLAVYVYSFVAILRKMASNSRMSKLSEKEDECAFTWKMFAGWDYMIGNAETAHNRVASTVLGFKEALVEEAERQREKRNWRMLAVRVAVNILVLGMLVFSAWAVVRVVERSTEPDANSNIWRQNETTVVINIVNSIFPILFELFGLLEQYHPRKTLRVQLGRIMALNLINIYTLILSLFQKINDMSKEMMEMAALDGSFSTTLPALTTPSSTPMKLPGVDCRPKEVPCGLTSSTALIAALTVLSASTTTVLPPSNSTLPSTHNATLESLPIVTTSPMPTTTMTPTPPWPSVNVTDDDDGGGEPVSSTTSPPHPGSSVDFTTSERMWSSPPSSSWSSPEWTSSYPGSSTTADEPFEDVIFHVRQNAAGDTRGLEALSQYLEDAAAAVDYHEAARTPSAQSLSPSGYDLTGPSSTAPPSSSSASTADTNPSSGSPSGSTDWPSVDPSEGATTLMPVSSSGSDLEAGSSPAPATSSEEEEKEDEAAEDGSSNSATTVTSATSTNSPTSPISPTAGTTNATATATTHGATPGTVHTTVAVHAHGLHPNNNNNNNNATVWKKPKSKLETRRDKRRLCWETMFGREMVKMTVMDLVMTVGSILLIDFFRAVFVRVMNNCWCWDLEKKMPQYGDFKIAENILHLVNNQGMVWMGMFFSPGLPLINLVKLAVLMYLRSWAVLTCNVPHEVVFRASRSNNFYLALLLTMLFLCVLPVGYTMVRLTPSRYCGPFSKLKHTADILTNSLKDLPLFMHAALNYMASPGIIIPLLLLLSLVIYYLISLTNSLREANNDLKIQLRRERTEERRKMFQIVDGRRGGGGGDLADKWQRLTAALPSAGAAASVEAAGKGAAEAGTAKPETSRRKELLARLLKHALRKSSATSDEESAVHTDQGGGQEAGAGGEPQDGDDATDAEQPDCLPDDEKGKTTRRSSRAARKARANGGQGIRDAVDALRRRAPEPAQPQPHQPPRGGHHHPHHHHHQRRRAADSPSLSSHREREDSVASTWSDGNIPEIRISKTESAECVLEGLDSDVPDGDQRAEPQRPSKSGSSDTIVAAEELAQRRQVQTRGSRGKKENEVPH